MMMDMPDETLPTASLQANALESLAPDSEIKRMEKMLAQQAANAMQPQGEEMGEAPDADEPLSLEKLMASGEEPDIYD